jgi:hypothetical protein
MLLQAAIDLPTTNDVSISTVGVSKPVIKLSALELAVGRLEKSTDRAEAVQSFADLYEVAGTKTLLVRTKYKYVRNYSSVYLTFI